jgi:predicted permease
MSSSPASFLTSFVADARFALRYFARHKAITGILIGVLALGTGANTLIFSIFQAQFLRPAPMVPQDAAHARIYMQQRPTATASWESRRFTVPELATLAQRRDVFTDVSAWVEEGIILSGGDSIGAQNAPVHFVAPNYFRTIGVPVGPGRNLNEGVAGVADLTGVMAAMFAEQLYGSAEKAIGRRVLVNEVPVEIVGIAPRRFQGAERDMDEPALWIPLSARSDITGASPRWVEDEETLALFARMAPGATHDQATAIVQQVALSTLPDSATRVGMSRMADVRHLGAIPPWEDGLELIVEFTLIGLLGLLILLVGWMNVSSLMVASAVSRRHEIGVRLALGASRLRLIRQLVTESTIISGLGAAAGSLIAYWMLTAIMAREVDGVDLTPDIRTFAFVAALAIATGVLFGLSPALHATRGVAAALRDSGGGASRKSRLQRTLVVAQITLSQPLLVLLGLMLSMVIAEYRPIAPETSGQVIGVTFRPLDNDRDLKLGWRSVEQLTPRIASRPEVLAVVPASAAFDVRGVFAPDREERIAAGDTVPTMMHLEGAAPGWFGVLDVPIVLGRDVALADTNSTDRPVVIGVDLAQALYGEANPIGRTLYSPGIPELGQDSIAMSVVGVYDSRVVVPGMVWAGTSTRSNIRYRVYTAHGMWWQKNRLLIRTRGDAAQYLPDLQRFAIAEAPSLPISSIRTLKQMDEQAYRVTVQVSMFAGLGGVIALALASLGLYGVVALAVRIRTREIGIRIAVGAHPMQVARMFLASGVKSAILALLIGLPITIIGVQFLVSAGALIIPGTKPYLIGGAIAALMLGVAALATWIPARRAAKVDPGLTLRAE